MLVFNSMKKNYFSFDLLQKLRASARYEESRIRQNFFCKKSSILSSLLGMNGALRNKRVLEILIKEVSYVVIFFVFSLGET